jgi:hypothetical protein
MNERQLHAKKTRAQTARVFLWMASFFVLNEDYDECVWETATAGV